MNLKIDIKSEPLRFEFVGLQKAVNSLRGKSGTYVFYGVLDNPIYVGMSRNLRRRLISHSYGSNVDLSNACYCIVYLTKDVAQADILETYLINELKPALNISKAVFHEFVVETEDRLAEIDYEIETLRREIEEKQAELSEYVDCEDDGYGEDHDEDLGGHLYLISEIRRIESEVARLKRIASTLKQRGAKSLVNITVEDSKDNVRRRQAAVFLSGGRR